MLVAGFRSRNPVRVFEEGWGDRAKTFAPDSVAATLAQFEALAAAKIPLRHSMIVLARMNEPRITEADRDRLWKWFEVPLFEQIIGPDCELLAFECEAHDGLHIASPKLAIDASEIDQSLCACGRAGPRWISPARRRAAVAR